MTPWQVGSGDVGEEGNHVDGEPLRMQDDDTLHVKLVGDDPKTVDGLKQLLQGLHAAWHAVVWLQLQRHGAARLS